jgi:DNA-binding MarR family transcriptional regulator
LKEGKTMNNDKPDLFEQFSRMQWLLHRYHQQNHRDHGPMGDPHRGQGRVLALLKLKPEISQKELSDILDIRAQSLGELLSKLERSGYITRTPSTADRRVMDIRLTDAGMAASGKEEQQPCAEALFGCLNEEEQAALGDYLGRIIAALEQQYSDGEPEGDFRGHPHFGGRGFGGHFQTDDGHPHFDGRDFDRHHCMGDRRPPFDCRDFGRGRGGDDGRQ